MITTQPNLCFLDNKSGRALSACPRPGTALSHCSVDITSFNPYNSSSRYYLAHLALGGKVPNAQGLRDFQTSAAKWELYCPYVVVSWLCVK